MRTRIKFSKGDSVVKDVGGKRIYYTFEKSISFEGKKEFEDFLREESEKEEIREDHVMGDEPDREEVSHE